MVHLELATLNWTIVMKLWYWTYSVRVGLGGEGKRFFGAVLRFMAQCSKLYPVRSVVAVAVARAVLCCGIPGILHPATAQMSYMGIR
jgi:hypothetical protein